MLKTILKKSISLALAFAVVLSLSCCGEGDEVSINETTTTQEIANAEAETNTSETTEELTTLETTTEEVTETTTEETSLTITDEETILASLTDEEKEVWLSMPDIVTIRILNTFANETTEICYIEKNGGVKSFISDEYYDTRYDTVDEIKDKIDQNQNAEIVNTVDIHNLIEFYNTLMLIDSESEMVSKYNIVPAIQPKAEPPYVELYGIKDDNEILLLLIGSFINPRILDDPYFNAALELYCKADIFITVFAIS